MKPHRRVGLRVAAGLVLATAASAASAACDVNAQGVAFGNYDPLVSSALDGVGNVNVSCTLQSSVNVSLSSGSGTFFERQMTSGATQLGYNLYKDSARLDIWGEGIVGGTSVTGTTFNLTVYGRIPGSQNVPAGVYVDSITVTISY